MVQDKHRKLLGNIFFGLGVIIMVLLLITLLNNPGSTEEAQKNSQIYISMLISVSIFITCGLALLSNHQLAHWICIPVSIIFIFAFPIGTAVGGYCLWYFWKFGLHPK
ncbi:MAG: hypothetical protein OEQ24_02810 [Gammaproteobacteria bacterium]|nr:hypothetical protein [Gammaproteobacteria bacterium]